MNSLGDILKQMLGQEYRLRDALVWEKLQKIWRQVADEPLASKVQPQGYRKKTLLLAASSASWSQQVVFYKQLIIDKYKALAPEVEIQDVRVKTVWSGLTARTAQSPAVENTAADDTAPTGAETRLQRLVRKADRLRRRDARRLCAVCGQRFEGAENICIFCRNKIRNERDAKISRYLAEAPWAKYTEIHGDWPDTDEEDFWRVHQKLQQQTLDALHNLWFEHYQRPLPARARPRAESLAMRYILLKTGLTPDKINDNIISGQLSRRLYKFIYGREPGTKPKDNRSPRR